MRTTIGLIIGLAFGMLLMHFSTSAFKVSELSDSRQRVEKAEVLPSPKEPSLFTHRQAVSASLVARWQQLSSADRHEVLVVPPTESGTPAAALIEAVHASVAAADSLTARSLSDPDSLSTEAAACALFCGDAEALVAILQQFQSSEWQYPPPPIFAAGWSAVVADACADWSDRIGGVALLIPTVDLQHLNELTEASHSTVRAASSPVARVLPPDEALRLMTTAEPTAR